MMSGSQAVVLEPIPQPLALGTPVTPGDLTAEVDRLRQLNRMRTQFVNTAAHEFATPLTPLRLQVHMLRAGSLGPLTPDQKTSLETMERNIERLSHLVRDVLDVARLESDRFHIDRKPTDVAALARDAVESFRVAAGETGVRLLLESPPSLIADADPDRIAQVFTNLLSNALKFTPRNGTIRLRIRPEETNWTAEVTDSGIGLRAEDYAKLFQPFSQLQNGAPKTKEGSGLGLSICQGIIHQHGGRIWCESPGPGQGTTFAFSIPNQTPAVPTSDGLVLLAPERIRSLVSESGWNLFCFKCPDCGSRDIEVRLLRNRYECNACRHVWK